MRQVMIDLSTALGSVGLTKQDFQEAYHDHLLAVAQSVRDDDGVAMMEVFTGDVGMVMGIVRKLAQKKGDGLQER